VLAQLSAKQLNKTRYSVPPFSIDVFEGTLEGLFMAEAELDSAAAAATLALSSFLLPEVSADDRFTDRLVCASRQELKTWLSEYGIGLRTTQAGLGPQRRNWRNSNGTPGRNPACEQRDRCERYGYSDQSDGIGRRDAEEQTGYQVRCALRGRETQRHSGQRKDRAGAQREQQDVAWLRSESHSNTEFLRSLADGIGHDAINPDGGQKQCQRAEDCHQGEREPAASERSRHHFGHGANPVNRQFGIHGMYDSRDRLLEPARAGGAAQKNSDFVHGNLIHRAVDAGHGRGIQPVMAHVRHHADDLVVDTTKVHAPSHVVAGQILFRERFVYDDDFLGLVRIRFGEGAPAQ
jgi:hypothetical protein